MKIVIIAAMDEELAPFRNHYLATKLIFQKGRIAIEAVTPTLYLVRSGIGKVNAAAATALACEKLAPDLFINTGTTGSFRSDLALGTVVYSNCFLYSDVDATGFGYAFGQVPTMPENYPVSRKHLDWLAQLFKDAPFSAVEGRIATADSFMSDVDAIAAIRHRVPGIVASDMESCAIAQIASTYAIPVLNIRGISDHVGQSAPETFRETVDFAANQAFLAVETICATLQEAQIDGNASD